MEPGEVMDLIRYVDAVNVRFGATTQCFSTDTPAARQLEKKALEHDLHLLQAQCKHLGTENNLKILANLYEHLREQIDYRFRTAVSHIDPAGEGYRLTLENGDSGMHLSDRRPGPLRGRVVCRGVQAAGHPPHQQSGGHRGPGGAARPGL